MITIQQALQQATQQLQDQGIASARLDARLLLCHVLEKPIEYLITRGDKQLLQQQQQHFMILVYRRLRHEPLSHILGRREFWGLRFTVNSHVLDPRADSETLVQAVLDHIPDRQHALTIADLGTGSGCLLLSLLYELPKAQGTAIDISAKALEVAKLNADRLNLTGRVTFQHHDWSQGLTHQYDCIISNPPYIPTNDIQTLLPEVRLYDPHVALDGGRDGLDYYRHLAIIAKPSLKPSGMLAIEVGLGQETSVENIFTQAGFVRTQWVCDLAGIPRCGIFNHS